MAAQAVGPISRLRSGLNEDECTLSHLRPLYINEQLHNKAENESFSGIIAEDHGLVMFAETQGASLDMGNGSLSASYYGVIRLGCETAKITSWGEQSNNLAINNGGRIDLHGTTTTLCARQKANTPIGLEHDGHILAEGAHIIIQGDNENAIVIQKSSTLTCNDIELRGTFKTAISAMSGSMFVGSFLGDIPGLSASTSATINIEEMKKGGKVVGTNAPLVISDPFTRQPQQTAFYQLVERFYPQFKAVYEEPYQERCGSWRPSISTAVEKFLECGDLQQGFARVRCPDCGHVFFVAFSCRGRCFCLRCLPAEASAQAGHQKRALQTALWVSQEVCAAVPHRQFVFTIPKRMRIYFRFDRRLLGELCRAAWQVVRQVYAAAGDQPDAVPGMTWRWIAERLAMGHWRTAANAARRAGLARRK